MLFSAGKIVHTELRMRAETESKQAERSTGIVVPRDAVASLMMSDFFESASDALDLEVIAGQRHLRRPIPEPSVNRPGLALAGFLQYFAHKRIQILGLAELTYLKSLSTEDRLDRLRRFYKKQIPGVVIARGRHAPTEVVRLAEEARVPVLKTRMITMDFINSATVILEEMTSPRTQMHGTMVDIMGVGVLIEGPPGIGKSEIALALIKRGHSLVADDITRLQRDRSGAIMTSAVDVTRYHMEIRGLGIVHIPSLFGVASMRVRMKLDMIVRLQKQGGETEIDRTGLEPKTSTVLGVDVPLTVLPVAAGRDLSLIIEAAALNQRLKLLGHDAAKELDDKLIEIMSKKSKVRK